MAPGHAYGVKRLSAFVLKAYGQLEEEGLEILCGLEISKLAGPLAYEHMAQPTLLGGWGCSFILQLEHLDNCHCAV